MNMNLRKLREIVEDRGGWCLVVHWVAKSWTWLSKQQQTTWLSSNKQMKQKKMPIRNHIPFPSESVDLVGTGAALVCLGRCNKCCRQSRLIDRNVALRVQESGSPGCRCWQFPWWGSHVSLVYRWQPSCCVLTLWTSRSHASSSSTRAVILSWGPLVVT